MDNLIVTADDIKWCTSHMDFNLNYGIAVPSRSLFNSSAHDRNG